MYRGLPSKTTGGTIKRYQMFKSFISARLMATMNRCRRLERVIKEQKDTIRNYENGEIASGSNFAGRSRIVKPVFGGMTK